MAINQAQLVDLLTEYRRENWRGIQTPEWQQKIVSGLAADSDVRILKRIAPYWKLPPDPVILDLGSGIGNFVVACRKRGLRAFGVEPDRIGQGSTLTSLRIAAQRWDNSPFAAAVGEQLPFRDDSFDLIVLDQVIEHVRDQRRVLGEAFRVLKPGGALYIACPNYLEFYESHYKVWFFPLMPKPLARLYLRARGRNPVLLNQITYTTNWRVRKLLRDLGVAFLDLHCEDFLAKCRAGNFTSRRARSIARLSRVRFFGPAVLKAVCLALRLREGGSEMLAFKPS